MKSEVSLYNHSFSHIYVEKNVMDNPRTLGILKHFPNAEVIEIEHYKDVFCRTQQNVERQKKTQALIIARKQGNLVYEGAKVCQSFGNEYFYYTSCIMNCIYDCDYCYLKGMYPSGNIVIFVNIDDIFAHIEKLLEMHPVYLCVSYDTDMCAFESITGFVKEWMEFCASHNNLTIEIRTKCGRKDLYDFYENNERIIFAYTLSPDEIVSSYERKTSSLNERLEAIVYGISKGFRVRLCFDPMIYCKDFRQVYKNMVDSIVEKIDMSRIQDVSIGSFRISKEYMKKMRKMSPYSAVAQFPYENIGGVYQYPESIQTTMKEYMIELLSGHIDRDRIFLDEI